MSFGISVEDVLKLCEVAMRVYKNCRDCPGEYKALTSEARNLTNILTDISDKVDLTPDNKRPKLLDAYEACVEVLQELDQILLHYNSLDTRSKRAWDRLNWDSAKSRSLRERLTSSVVLLNSFYTSLVVDSQVLILEALKRLELDYRGGHRNESIASIEKIASDSQEDAEDEEGAAWAQVVCDLEEAGISRKDAADYRDFIVDWFVRTVNQGRLLEQPLEQGQIGLQSPFSTLSEIFNDALPGSSTYSAQGLAFPRPSTDEPSSSSSPSTFTATSSSAAIPGRFTHVNRESELPDQVLGRPPTYTETPISLNGNRLPGETDYEFVDPEPPGRSPTSRSLPSYDQIDASTENDLVLRANRIIDAWERRDFITAGKHLEDQLVAVERGETSVLNGAHIQPGRRVLRHLMGVCASYSGDFVKAKALFETVFNGINLSGVNMDDGDIAAARWIGDCCLHLDETAEDTAFAWAVALVGLIEKYGDLSDVARRVASELKSLDNRLQSLQRLEQSLRRNHDSLTVFRSARASEKLALIMKVKDLKSELAPMPGGLIKLAVSDDPTAASSKSMRPYADWRVARSFLVEPLISQSAWPLQWDTTFDPFDAINLHWRMHSSAFLGGGVFRCNEIPSASLVSSTNVFHFVTKRDVRWLADAVRDGLAQMGITFREQSTTFMCRLSQRRDGFAFSEGVAIKFRKVQFRSMYGIWITDVQLSTRGIPKVGSTFLARQSDTDGFRDVLRGILETAANKASINESQTKDTTRSVER